MCGPGIEVFLQGNDEADERLDKHIGQLKEASRLAQVYYNNEQWPLLEKVNQKIIIITTMIKTNLIENERYIDENWMWKEEEQQQLNLFDDEIQE